MDFVIDYLNESKHVALNIHNIRLFKAHSDVKYLNEKQI